LILTMSLIITIPKWNEIFYSKNKIEITTTIDILNNCINQILNEVENPTFDHDSENDIWNGCWDHGSLHLRSWLRIAGKLINRHHNYDYIAEYFPGLVTVTIDKTGSWDSGLDDSNCKMSYFILDKSLKVVKTNC